MRYNNGVLFPLDEAGIAYDAAEIIARINPLGYLGTATYFSALGVPGTQEEIVERTMGKLEEYYTEEVTAAPGADAFVRRMKEEGVRLFVLTASPHRLTDPCLRSLSLFDLFEQVWCVDDFGYGKSQPELYPRVTAAIGCAPEEILFFDDGVLAICTARAAGWRTCGVCPPHAVENVGMTETAHTCITTFEELL